MFTEVSPRTKVYQALAIGLFVALALAMGFALSRQGGERARLKRVGEQAGLMGQGRVVPAAVPVSVSPPAALAEPGVASGPHEAKPKE